MSGVCHLIVWWNSISYPVGIARNPDHFCPGSVSWVVEQSHHLGPNCPIQRLHGERLGIAPALAAKAGAVGPVAAIVAVPWLRCMQRRFPAATERISAGLADQQTLQQIACACLALTTSSPVLGQLLLRGFEHRGVDQRRDRDDNPLLGRGQEPTTRVLGDRAASARRTQWWLPRRCSHSAEPCLTCISWVREQCRHHALVPAFLACRAGHAALEQTPAHQSQTDALLGDPLKHATNHRGLALDHLETCPAIGSLVATDVAVAVRRPTKHTDYASLGQMPLTAAATLDDARALVFRKHPLQLQ